MRIKKSVFLELARLVRSGGYLIITTPNEEDIKENCLICPECGCEFHRGQHIHSFDQIKLADTVSQFGFVPVFCKPVMILPDLTIWLKAKRESRQWMQQCPDCQRAFYPPRKGLLGSIQKLVSESRHLLCIGRRK